MFNILSSYKTLIVWQKAHLFTEVIFLQSKQCEENNVTNNDYNSQCIQSLKMQWDLQEFLIDSIPKKGAIIGFG